MNLFRLVLCLAGLAAYLVVRQWIQPSVPASSPAPPAVPAPEVRAAVPPGFDPAVTPPKDPVNRDPGYARIAK